MLQDPDIYAILFPAALIFFARLADVTLGTMRIIFISKGLKYIAPIVGFFEVIIWLVAIGQVMNDVDNILAYIAYGGGFAAGTYLGMMVENRMSLGKVMIRLITQKDPQKFVDFFRQAEIKFTLLDARSGDGIVTIIYIIAKQNIVPFIADHIQQFNEKTLYTIEDLRSVSDGIFPRRYPSLVLRYRRWRPLRKGK